MSYTKVDLFGHQSKGTFDDFFSTEKYNSLQEAYDANDYVECDFVRDESGILYIEARNVRNPEIKKYYRLNFQRPVCGIDILDDHSAIEIAATLF